MLTYLPEEVLDLFRNGYAKKNLSIRFPNGEHKEIDNSNIVSESFSMVESISSGDTLKFGLCEASMVEFETINIGNIKGCTIDVILEILCGHVWYPVNLGTYIVDSCQKQSNMNRRIVKAYSIGLTFDKLSALEIGKRRDIAYNHATRGYYDFELLKYIALNFLDEEEFALNKKVYLKLNEVGVSDYKHELNSEYSWSVKSFCKSYTIEKIEELDDLFFIYNYYNESGVINNIKNEFKEKITEWSNLYFEGYYDVDYYVKESLKYAYPWVSDSGPYGGISLNDDRNFIYLYPYGYSVDPTTQLINIYVPYQISIDLYSNGILKKGYSYVLNSSPSIYKIITSEWKTLMFTEKGDFVKKPANPRDLTESYTEIMGMFGKSSRVGGGGLSLVSVNSKFGLYPSETLYPSNDLYPKVTNLLTKSTYKSAWYDDDYTLPYSKVTCTYKRYGTLEDAYAEYEIIEVEDDEKDKYQTYDISDNYYIKETPLLESQVLDILKTLASNIENIRYMPADIDLKGLPYIEAGDIVQVITKDGGFETIVLQRTLTGIQQLNDNYESRG